MTFIEILQEELKAKGHLEIDDVMSLCQQYNHYYDTARRNLEPDKTPFAKKTYKKGRVSGWDYVVRPVIFKDEEKKELDMPMTLEEIEEEKIYHDYQQDKLI